MMTRKVRVEVGSLQEAKAIERALARPDVRAFCAIAGVLDELPSDRARTRVLRYVQDHITDPDSALPTAIEEP